MGFETSWRFYEFCRPNLAWPTGRIAVFKRSLLAFGLLLGGIALPATCADAQAPVLPQWLPVGTFDKPLNEAADDVGVRHRFKLRDCGNSGRHFVCTYASDTGIGVVAWSSQPVGLIEQLTIAIPACKAIDDLSDLSAMLIHILHPRRPVATFPRTIVAMARFAANTGSGEHWLDNVSYQLIDRKARGLGLVVHRTPPNAIPPSASMRKRVADAQRFYIPPYKCPGADGVVLEPVPESPRVAAPHPVISINK